MVASSFFPLTARFIGNTMPITLTSPDATTVVDLTPQLGGAISALRHEGANVLWTPPRHTRDLKAQAPAGFESQSEISWMESSLGGWEVLAPNAGSACTVGSSYLPFHGHAGRSKWQVDAVARSSATLSCAMPTTGFRSSRQVQLVGNGRCEVRESLSYEGPGEHPAIWGSHLAFGDEFVDGPLRFEQNGTVVGGQLDGEDRLSALTARIAEGTLTGPSTGLVYLHFRDVFPMVALINRTSGVRVTVSWNPVVFPFAWIWVELHGTTGWPWFGSASALGVEPMSSWPAVGLSEAIFRGAPVQHFRAGESVSADISVTVQGEPPQVTEKARPHEH